MTSIFRFSTYTLLSVLYVSSLFLWVQSVSAYTVEEIPGGDVAVGDFVVGPTKTELTIEPGTEKVMELLVTNRMGERRSFRLSTEDAKGSDDPSQTVVLLGDDRGPYSLKDYLKFEETNFELESGQRARIPVTVSIPQDAQPGGLYGSVIVTTASVPVTGDTTIQTGAKAGSVIEARIASLFFITIPGEIEKKGSLVEFSTIPNEARFFSTGPINFQILFENTGSVHLNPYGTVSIKNLLGEEVGTLRADPWFAMPESTRRRELSWDRPYLLGYYTAELQLHRGYGADVDTATVSFFVLPWKVLVLLFAGITGVAFALRFITRTFEIKKK